MMNSSATLSVIIPLYNAGNEFIACMESLVTQTWTALEIIIVNDGSTDHSAEIAESYVQKYPHIQLIHQPNAGASVARNRGLEQATGEYVAFVDADDIVYPEMYETLMKMALEDDLDVAQCNSDWCERQSGHTWQSIPLDRIRSTGGLSGPDWLRMALASRRWTHVVWMGVYRRDVITRNNITFVPGLHHQDIIWSTEFMYNAKRARYTEQSLYKYFLHDTSVSRLKRGGLQHLNYQRHYIKITRLLENLNQKYADKITIYPEFHQQITYEALRVCHSVRKERDLIIRQRMIAEIFTSGMFKRMVSNVRSAKLAYQVLLWSIRLYKWRDKTISQRRLARKALKIY
ncbi:glycosyltransferase [Salmonella enterica]